MNEQFDVIIVGYGPTGLVLASFLGGKGHRVAVVERWASLYGMPRLSHIDDETARIIQATANVDDALRDSAPIDSFTFFNAAGEVLTKVGDAETGLAGFPKDISIYQPDIEDALDAAVRICPNVTLFLGRQAIALAQDDTGVTLDIVGRSSPGVSEVTETLHGRYLVGSDGANSFVREQLGISRTDFGFNERWLNIDTELLRPVDPIYSRTVQFCDPRRGHMHLPIGTKRLRFELAVLRDEKTEDYQKPEFAWSWLASQHGLGPDDVSIIRQVVYTFEAKTAERWSNGRVFIAGDAAHTMPPYMGQGACSGMRDALNLGWKLDLVVRQTAAPEILDSYQQERHPHVAAITMMSLKLGEIANEHDVERAKARDAYLKANKPAKPELPDMASGLLDPLRSPLTGEIWPQAMVTCNGVTGRFDDLIGHGFVLLVAAGQDIDLEPAQLDGLRRIDCKIAVLGQQFLDTSGRYTEYLASHGVRYLIARPDFTVFGSADTADGLRRLVDALGERLQLSSIAIAV